GVRMVGSGRGSAERSVQRTGTKPIWPGRTSTWQWRICPGRRASPESFKVRPARGWDGSGGGAWASAFLVTRGALRWRGFPHARRSQDQQRLLLPQPGAGRQRLQLGPLDRRLEGEVEVGQRLARRQAREPQRRADPPLLAPLQLAAEQLLQQGR